MTVVVDSTPRYPANGPELDEVMGAEGTQLAGKTGAGGH